MTLKDPLYFEDVEVGYKFSSPGARTITNAEVVNFAQLTGDYNLVHLDHEYAKQSLYGEPLVHGACMFAIMGGLFKRTEFCSKAAETMLTLTELKQVKYIAPVKFNDTVHLEVEILEKADEADDTGLVTLSFNGFNQRNEQVLDCIRVYRFAKANYQPKLKA